MLNASVFVWGNKYANVNTSLAPGSSIYKKKIALQWGWINSFACLKHRSQHKALLWVCVHVCVCVCVCPCVCAPVFYCCCCDHFQCDVLLQATGLFIIVTLVCCDPFLPPIPKHDASRAVLQPRNHSQPAKRWHSVGPSRRGLLH